MVGDIVGERDGVELGWEVVGSGVVVVMSVVVEVAGSLLSCTSSPDLVVLWLRTW